MTETHTTRTRVDPPIVAPPTPFVERRVSYRRAADQQAHHETTLLAHSLDVLAADAGAEERLAGLLDLLARTVNARRAAVLADGAERRIAVACSAAEDDDGETAARDLAAWLDAWAPRPRSHRAASGAASVSIVVASPVAKAARSGSARRSATKHFACLPIPSAGGVVLGFDFADERAAAALETNLPPQLARHAAVALALVTEQIATERELESLRASDAERNRFVSTVAHELRTPLTGLSGYLELILNGQVADETDELDFLERSRQIVDTMTELVGDLLELSRLESGALRLEIGQFSLAEAAGRVVGGLTPLAMSRGVELNASLPPRLRSATGDRRRVEQILTNLVGNALKFAPSGSTIDLEARFEGSVAIAIVRDEGAGILPDDRARIFDRFYRLAGHEKITGTGLGLPIARDLARRMDGDLEVASVPGSGSSFVLVLPGPAGAPEEDVAHSLERAVGREEVLLEERAVLRAISAPTTAVETVLRVAGKDHHQRRGPRPTLAARGNTDQDLVGSSASSGDRPANVRPRLRAIDGLASRRTDPSPA
jgi:signal transduction histidine kinase